MDLKLSYNKRQFIFEYFNKAFVGYKILDSKRIADVYGPATQTLLREALHTYCFQYPLKTELIKVDEGLNSEKKKVIKEYYKFTINILLPIFGGEIVLEQQIEKEILESK